MKILPNTYAVFWTRPGWSVRCHADLARLPGETPKAARKRYAEMFPADIVYGLKDHNGRWVA